MASAEIGHDALVDLASEKTFQAPDDLPFGPAVRRAACHVLTGRLMVPHADDDGSIEGRVGVSVAASIEAVPAGIEYDKIDKLRGMDITITTSAKNDEEGRALLRAFNFPLKQ